MKPVAVVLHPKAWEKYGDESEFEYVHVSIGGKNPKKKNGTPSRDGYADVVVPTGVNRLEKVFRERQPDLFLFWLHYGMAPHIIAKLKEISPKTKFIMWYGNHRFQVPRGVTIYKPFLNMVLINSKDKRQYKIYRDHGISHVATLYDGFDPDETLLTEDAPICDCFFGGNSYIKKAFEVSGLNFPGAQIRFKLIMEAMENFDTRVRSNIKGCWPFDTLPETFHPEHTRSLREAKITLNVNHFPTFYKAYTRRTIRSIFARRCHLTYYIPGMEDDFENHKHLVWFNRVDDGVDLIRYYLDHDGERERIAWNGWRHACENFTFKHRMKDFEKAAEVLL